MTARKIRVMVVMRTAKSNPVSIVQAATALPQFAAMAIPIFSRANCVTTATTMTATVAPLAAA